MSLQVKETKNYELFSSINGNRPKNQLHLKRLKKSMEEELLVSPIIVNEKYEVIDGQHRLQISEELRLPVRYIVCEGYGLEQVHRLNQNSKNWQLIEFIKGYSDMGNKEYIKFLDFLNTYNFGVTSSMDLLGGHSGKTSNAIKEGSLVIKDYKNGCLLAEYITEMGKYFEFYAEQSFVKAIVRVSKKEGFCLDTFLSKMQLKPLQKRTDINAYVEQIEEVYNYENRNKLNLRY